MSTKVTLAQGEGFHLYWEMMDETVCLTLDGPGPKAFESGVFKGGTAWVTVALPEEVRKLLQPSLQMLIDKMRRESEGDKK